MDELIQWILNLFGSDDVEADAGPFADPNG